MVTLFDLLRLLARLTADVCATTTVEQRRGNTMTRFARRVHHHVLLALDTGTGLHPTKVSYAPQATRAAVLPHLWQ